MLKLGYKASAEQFPPRQLLEFAVHAEAVGFDSIMVSDHFQPWRHTDGHAPFSFAWLAALGERTSRALIGTSVVTPTFRYHPAIVAQAIGTLGSLYPGRVLLGVGTGELERGAGNRHGVAAVQGTLRTAARGDRAHAAARARGARELRRRVLSHRARDHLRPPRGAGADLRRRFRRPRRAPCRAPRRGLHLHQRQAKELYTETLLPAVAEGLAKAGRDAGIEYMIEMKVSFDPDRARALEDTRHWAALALSPEEKTGIEDPVDMERLADALPIERAARRWIVSSDPDEHVERLAETVALGFTHLIFHAPGPDQGRFLDLYAAQVLPRLRARYGGTAEARQPRPAQLPRTRRRPQSRARSRTGGTLSWQPPMMACRTCPLRAAAQEDRIRETAGHSHDCFRLSPSLLSAEAQL